MSFGSSYLKKKAKSRVIETEIDPRQLEDILAVHLQALSVVSDADDITKIEIEGIPPWNVHLKIHVKEVPKKSAKMA